MARRGRMSKRHSKHVFRKSAAGTHYRNVAGPMRGGIRL